MFKLSMKACVLSATSWPANSDHAFMMYVLSPQRTVWLLGMSDIDFKLYNNISCDEVESTPGKKVRRGI